MNNFQENFNIDGEININFIRNFALRNKKLILLVLIIGTLGGYLYSNSLQKMWKGSFQILLKDLNKQSGSDLTSKLLGFNIKGNKELMTEKTILTSPSVLMPVFEFVKNESKEETNISEKTSFQDWINSSLEVNFEENTTVLEITYKSSRKQLIEDVLKLISKKYQEYSLLERERNINNTLEYLINQEEKYLVKSKVSMKNLNEFSIKNGLGDIDGFVSFNPKDNLEKGNMILENISGTNPNLYSLQNNSSNKAGQRFSRQFSMLENYETQYLDLSSKLKPNSKTLSNLKLKIDNIKESLKRPNEILLQYRELVKIAARDEILLNTIQQNLNILKLEKSKNFESWQLISNPKIEQNNFYPNLKRLTILYFFGSFFTGCLLAYIIERKSGLIYEFQNLEKLLKTNYKNEIYIDDSDLSKKLIDKIFQNFDIMTQKFGLLLISDEQSNNFFNTSSLFLKDPKYQFFNFNELDKIEEVNKFLIIIKLGKVNRKQIDKLNIFLDLYKDKVIGWSSLSKLN